MSANQICFLIVLIFNDTERVFDKTFVTVCILHKASIQIPLLVVLKSRYISTNFEEITDKI